MEQDIKLLIEKFVSVGVEKESPAYIMGFLESLLVSSIWSLDETGKSIVKSTIEGKLKDWSNA